MNRLFKYTLGMMLAITGFVYAWDGYDYNAGEEIEVGRGNLVRRGSDIEVYHWDEGSYHDEEVQGMFGNELETYDYDTGEYHYYEMK